MNATRPRPRKSPRPPARPVTEVLLEIAYRMHATRAVALKPKDRRGS